MPRLAFVERCAWRAAGEEVGDSGNAGCGLRETERGKGISIALPIQSLDSRLRTVGGKRLRLSGILQTSDCFRFD